MRLTLGTCFYVFLANYYSQAHLQSPKSFRNIQLEKLHHTINTVVTLSLTYTTLLPYSSLASTLPIDPSTATKVPPNQLVSFIDVASAAEFIETNCRQLLGFVKSSGRLLYRGEEALGISSPALIALTPDLLSPYTYGGAAADYFRSLDESPEASALSLHPGRAHLAVSSQMRASQWGPVYSIWPLDRFDYAWLNTGNVWWEDEWGTPQNPRGPFFWRREDSLRALLRNEVVANTYLDGALQKESEVMLSTDITSNNVDTMFSGIQEFLSKNSKSLSTSSSPTLSSSVLRDKTVFKNAVVTQGQLLAVAVPVIKESQLLERLGVVPYSSQVPVRMAAPMEADNIRYSKDPMQLRTEFASGGGNMKKAKNNEQ